jgi:hypothetical protein
MSERSGVPRIIKDPKIPKVLGSSKTYKAKLFPSESSGILKNPKILSTSEKAYKASSHTSAFENSYSKNSFDSYKNKCKKDLQKQIQQLLNSVILTKMCLIKYIAEIVDIKHNSICVKDEDLSKQKQAFTLLSQDEQNKYKKMVKENRDDIMFYRDLLTFIKIDDKTCEDQKLQVDKYTRELDLVMTDLATISQKLYKINL